jgi:hypothetical protein
MGTTGLRACGRLLGRDVKSLGTLFLLGLVAGLICGLSVWYVITSDGARPIAVKQP